jgi:hypothetical protein
MTAILVDIIGAASNRQGFVFDPKDGGIGLSRVSLSDVSGFSNEITANYTDPITDYMYFVHSANKLAIWDYALDYLEYEWESKVYLLPYAAVPQAAQVKGENGTFETSVEFSVLSDGAPYYTRDVDDDMEFVLPPPMFGAKEFQMKVSGINTIRWLQAADSMEELG